MLPFVTRRRRQPFGQWVHSASISSAQINVPGAQNCHDFASFWRNYSKTFRVLVFGWFDDGKEAGKLLRRTGKREAACAGAQHLEPCCATTNGPTQCMSFILTFAGSYSVIRLRRSKERISFDHVFLWSVLLSTFRLCWISPLVTLKVIADKADGSRDTPG
jgi:hypothetical protein